MLRRTLFGLIGTTVLGACDRRDPSGATAEPSPSAAQIAPDAPVDPAFTGCTA
jgi:hypothetical protein